MTDKMRDGQSVANKILESFNPQSVPDAVGSQSSSKQLINLLRGHVSSRWPNLSLLPTHILERATRDVLNDPSIAYPAMCYGPDEGDPRLRKNIAAWLTEFYQPRDAVSVERICITGGASQSLACLLQDYTDPEYTRNVWIVAPAYMLSFRIFEDSGFHEKMRAIPEDEEGIDIHFLRDEIEKSEHRALMEGNTKPRFKPSRNSSKVYKHVIYAVPTFSNPSSRTMSLRRRQEIVLLARQFDALIVTDDVYDFLQWPSSPDATTGALVKSIMPRLVDIDRYLDGGTERPGADGYGNTVSNGSFSKIFGPGLRTGWCEGSPKLAYGVSQTGSSRSGGSPSQLTACFVAETLEHGQLQRYVYDHLQLVYSNRYHRLIQAIHKHLTPLGTRIPQTDRETVGGYFVWITLPSPLKGSEFAQRAKEDQNVVVAKGEIFEVPGDNRHVGTSLSEDIRLCFAWEDEDMLVEGIERLAIVIETMLSEQGKSDRLVHPRPLANGDSQQFW